MKRVKEIIAGVLTGIMMLVGSIANADFTHFPPKGSGSLHTYTVWDRISWGYDCKNLINYGYANGIISDSYGIVKYGDYFAGATTNTFGKVGDLLIVLEEDGIVYPVIIQDIKNQNDSTCNVWGHYYGKCIVEFQILSCMRETLYGSSGGYVSEYMNKPIYKVINLGSIYENEYYFNNVRQACADCGLAGYYLLTSPYGGEVI